MWSAKCDVRNIRKVRATLSQARVGKPPELHKKDLCHSVLEDIFVD